VSALGTDDEYKQLKTVSTTAARVCVCVCVASVGGQDRRIQETIRFRSIPQNKKYHNKK